MQNSYLKGGLIWLLIAYSGAIFAASSAQSCSLISGHLLQLSGKPLFKFNRGRKYSPDYKYPLSHTQFFIRGGNTAIYKVVVDNLFYINLTSAQAVTNRDVGIVADFNRHYHPGSSVEACGKIYRQNGNPAIHFVHPSGCAANSFNGFLRINGAEISSNLKYCANCACSSERLGAPF